MTDDYFYCDVYAKPTKKQVEDEMKKSLAKYRADPNNYIYDFSYNVREEVRKHAPTCHVFKRRQRTQKGPTNPITMMDDLGKPLFVTSNGEITTESRGNEILWGEWFDACVVPNVITQIAPTADMRKDGSGLGLIANDRYHEPTHDTCKYAIDADRAHHNEQQFKKIQKVSVDYKIEQIKDGWEETLYHGHATRVVARTIPTDMISTVFKRDSVEQTAYSEIALKIIDYEYNNAGKKVKMKHSVGDHRIIVRTLHALAAKHNLFDGNVIIKNEWNMHDSDLYRSCVCNTMRYSKKIGEYEASITIHQLKDKWFAVNPPLVEACHVETAIQDKNKVFLDNAPKEVVEKAHMLFAQLLKNAKVVVHQEYDMINNCPVTV